MNTEREVAAPFTVAALVNWKLLIRIRGTDRGDSTARRLTLPVTTVGQFGRAERVDPYTVADDAAARSLFRNVICFRSEDRVAQCDSVELSANSMTEVFQ